MNNKYRIILISLSILTGTLSLLIGCGKKDALAETDWVAIKAVVQDRVVEGEELSIALGGNATLTFDDKLAVSIHIRDFVAKGSYTIEEGIITITTSGDTFSATLEEDVLTLELGGMKLDFVKSDSIPSEGDSSEDDDTASNGESPPKEEKVAVKTDFKYEISLSTGTYICGIDFPEGTYTIEAQEGTGSVQSGELGQDPLPAVLLSTEEFEGLFTLSSTDMSFSKDQRMMIIGHLTVRCGSDDADENFVSTRALPKDRTDKTLGPGEYFAGIDFPEGEYTIKAAGHIGHVYTEGFYVGCLNEVFSTDGEEAAVKEAKNVLLSNGIKLIVEDTSIILH
ncbi:MAG: hypothetical protein LBQ95_07890 [Lachnospiraceae bacterium]|jgi:hypothetical protein|nr:hypothetical protein [Lachnospiraceae bacterium]